MLYKQKKASLNLTLNVTTESLGIDINEFIAVPPGFFQLEMPHYDTVPGEDDLADSPSMMDEDYDDDFDEDEEEYEEDEEMDEEEFAEEFGEEFETEDIDEFDFDEEFGFEEDYDFDEDEEDDEDDEDEEDEEYDEDDDTDDL